MRVGELAHAVRNRGSDLLALRLASQLSDEARCRAFGGGPPTFVAYEFFERPHRRRARVSPARGDSRFRASAGLHQT